ncbi:MAG: lipase family protein [Brasilonema angustatum HA4187-MV1]|jgi:hypothetical protein|nr:lipase family protein [Brasilonema angustatum HA4187-MV1]
MSLASINLPKVLRGGFDFNEAILLSKMSKRAFKIYPDSFGRIEGQDIRDTYNASYKHEDWEFIYGIHNFIRNLRGFILKKKNSNHYAIVFRGSVVTQQQSIDLTNFLSDFNSNLINYGEIGNIYGKPIKVVEGTYLDYESIKQEILLFFKVIALAKIEAKDFFFINNEQISFEQKIAMAVALAAASGIVFGEEFEQILLGLISNYINNFQTVTVNELDNLKIQPVDDSSNQINFQELISKIKHLQSANLIIDGRSQSIIGRKAEHINIYVTGHSQAACIANFCSLSLKQHLNDFPKLSYRLKCYTIGGIKVGNQAFADFYNDLVGIRYSYRIENVLDLQKNMPFGTLYPLNLFVSNGFTRGEYHLEDYAFVGIPHYVIGFGIQNFKVDFTGALTFMLGMPFPHGFDTYIQLLEEQQAGIRMLMQPINGILSDFLQDYLREQEVDIVENVKNYTHFVQEDLSLEIDDLKRFLDEKIGNQLKSENQNSNKITKNPSSNT